MRWACAVLLVTGLACGDDGIGGRADGSVADAASLPDAPPTGGPTVTVNVVASGVPIEGLPIAYANPDGTLVGTLATDAGGRAVIGQFPVGGSVTAQGTPFRYAERPSGALTTIFDVQDGDVLYFGLPAPAEVAGSFDAQFQDNGSGGTCLVYACGARSEASCPGDADPVSIKASVDASCVNDSGSYDLVAYVETNGNRSETATALSGTLEAGPEPTVVIIAPAAVPLASVTSSFVADGTARTGRQQLLFARDGAVVESIDVAASFPASATTDLARDVVPATYDRVTFVTEAGATCSRATIAQSVVASPTSGAPTTNTVAAGDLLPTPGTATVTEESGRLSIALADQSAASCDGTVTADSLRIRVRADIDGVGAPGFAEWLMIAPVGTSIASPELPEQFGGSWPTQSLSNYAVLVETIAHSTATWPDYRGAQDHARSVAEAASRASDAVTVCSSALGTIPD